jgi:anti-anti-sigma regulatory factor
MNWRKWIKPRSQEERRSRQEQLVNILALASLLLGTVYLLVLAFIWLVLAKPVGLASFLGGLICVALALTAYFLSRSGRVRAGAIVIVAAGIILGMYSGYVRGPITVAAMLLVPAVLFAAVSIGGLAGAIVAVIEFALCALSAAALDYGWVPGLTEQLSPLTGLVLIGANLALVALVLWQTLRTQEAFLRRAEERGQALQALADDKDRLLAELQERDQAQRRLLATIRELGSPIVPLAEGIIAMPLVGAMDSGRSQQMMTALLERVAAHRARVAIVDITGVPVVDTAVAGALLRAAQGVRLLGATPILVGIRPEVARTLVEMGLGFEGLLTRSSLQEGLVEALALLGARIVTEAAEEPAS